MGTSSSKADQTWSKLNPRQRLYLTAVFDFDQAAEADIKRQSAKRMRTPLASEWRQITYDIKLPKEVVGYSSVQSVLRRAGQYDPGSGSSLVALERRGLVQVTHDTVYITPFGHVPRIRVRLTTLGRATARAGKGITTPAQPTARVDGPLVLRRAGTSLRRRGERPAQRSNLEPRR
jgi:hypothetical protein